MGEPSKYPGFHHRVSWPKFMGLRLSKERLGDYYWVCPDDSKLNIMFDVWLRATHGW